MQMVVNWYKGFWELLTFSMQMALMVITASAVANAPMIRGWIADRGDAQEQPACRLYDRPHQYRHFHFALGIGVGSRFAAGEGSGEILVRKRSIPFEYGLMGAAAYLGQMTWHGGLGVDRFADCDSGTFPWKNRSALSRFSTTCSIP